MNPSEPLVCFLLLAGHALADYPLQGDFLAKGKQGLIPGVPRLTILLMHGLIHGGVVALITGSVWLGIAETTAHCFIDEAKTKNLFNFNGDQLLHVVCKLIWFLIFISTGGGHV